MTVFNSPHAKAIVAFIVTVAGGAVAQGLIVGRAAVWVTLVIGALATAGVWTVKNLPARNADTGAVTLSVLLLVMAVLFFVAAAIVEYRWFGVSGEHPLGLVALGSASFAAAHLPI